MKREALGREGKIGMNYGEWEKAVSEEIRGDSLWRVEAYRLGLFIADISWYDVTKLMQDKRTLGLSNQLYRAIGSISANIAEGYSRGTGKDRARFYEYSLGSAREGRDWYHKGRHVVGETITQHRLSLLTQVIRLLLTMIPQQRGRVLREHHASYQVVLDTNREELDKLLQDVKT
ncbi:MAG: four helix bundle protein [Chloroflexota bacterium]|nr:four helix bundle protein [Chloroflexota bacterium]